MSQLSKRWMRIIFTFLVPMGIYGLSLVLMESLANFLHRADRLMRM
jgi:hypothetical protein